jgi:hypothetical protein
MTLEAEARGSGAPQYARFTRRLRGIVIDWMIVTIMLFGALFIATTQRNDDVSRAIGILAVVVMILYEPVLVSLTGGTLGHYFSNLRVVDDGHGGNVSFLKALARLIVKSLLGWFSFLVMMATRRNQAIHDLMTRSTVQTRDAANAKPHHYIAERTDFEGPAMPSRLRRLGVISGYLLLLIFIFLAGYTAIVVIGGVSAACINGGNCPVSFKLFETAWSLAWLLGSAICIGLGWRGKLPGARRAAAVVAA